jgi:epsilon-lactone hydrolase
MTRSSAASRRMAGFSWAHGPFIGAIVVAASAAFAQTAPTREVQAHSVPVPDTVSPQMQKIIGAPPPPTWNAIPGTADEWRAQVDAGAAAVMATLPAMREQLHVKVEPQVIDGVKTFTVAPERIPMQNRNRLLIHVHGGCYVSNPGESGTTEAILMAGLGSFKVISVDYRMPPDAPYPAALDDAMTV